jgi:hypothetical protein
MAKGKSKARKMNLFFDCGQMTRDISRNQVSLITAILTHKQANYPQTFL